MTFSRQGISQFYEQTGVESNSSYYLGSRLIAQRKGIDPSYTLNYVLQDSLGSTSVSVDSAGSTISTIKYFSFGAARYTTGALPTDKLFTGQRLDDTGLYYYGARYYDASIPIRGDEQGRSFLPINRDGIRKMRRRIGRFISADTIVPDPINPQSLNRYSYCLNNPLKYTDPSGHDPYMDYIYAIEHGSNPTPSSAPGSKKKFKVHRTNVFVLVNYIGDNGIETMDLEDMKIPAIFTSFQDKLGKIITYQYGGGNAPGWVGCMGLLAEAERMWFLVNSGKNIIATQQLIIEGSASYNASSGQTTIDLTIYKYVCSTSDGGYINYSPDILVDGGEVEKMNVVDNPCTWPSSTRYSLVVSKVPRRIRVDLMPGYKGAGNPCLKDGYPALSFEYE